MALRFSTFTTAGYHHHTNTLASSLAAATTTTTSRHHHYSNFDWRPSNRQTLLKPSTFRKAAPLCCDSSASDKYFYSQYGYDCRNDHNIRRSLNADGPDSFIHSRRGTLHFCCFLFAVAILSQLQLQLSWLLLLLLLLLMLLLAFLQLFAVIAID